MITAASFRSLALIRLRPVDLIVLRADIVALDRQDFNLLEFNSRINLRWSEWDVFEAHFCLIAFARDIPILVKKLLK